MKCFRYFTVFVSAVLLLTLTGCMGGWPETITSGFSDEMKAMLKDSYELTVPPSAVFIEGFYDHALQDNSVFIAFTVNEAELEGMFSTGWRKDVSGFGYTQASLLKLMKKDVLGSYIYENERYTYLYFSASENGVVTCALKGCSPPNETIP